MSFAPSSISIHGQGADGAACRWDGAAGRLYSSSKKDSCRRRLWESVMASSPEFLRDGYFR